MCISPHQFKELIQFPCNSSVFPECSLYTLIISWPYRLSGRLPASDVYEERFIIGFDSFCQLFLKIFFLFALLCFHVYYAKIYGSLFFSIWACLHIFEGCLLVLTISLLLLFNHTTLFLPFLKPFPQAAAIGFVLSIWSPLGASIFPERI